MSEEHLLLKLVLYCLLLGSIFGVIHELTLLHHDNLKILDTLEWIRMSR